MEQPKYKLRLDGPGIFWVAFCCSWTAILAMGGSFLWHRRHMPLLKVRELRLSLSAIACLHAYWMAVQFAYIVLPFPEQAEYWIMGIYLPFGIGLFHASNIRFLHIAKEQRKFVRGNAMDYEKTRPVQKFGFLRSNLNRTRKTLVIVGIGMFVQVMRSRRKKCQNPSD